MLKAEPLQEALRLFPPGHISIREAVEDLDLDGHFVPKGTWMHVRAASPTLDALSCVLGNLATEAIPVHGTLRP